MRNSGKAAKPDRPVRAPFEGGKRVLRARGHGGRGNRAGHGLRNLFTDRRFERQAFTAKLRSAPATTGPPFPTCTTAGQARVRRHLWAPLGTRAWTGTTSAGSPKRGHRKRGTGSGAPKAAAWRSSPTEASGTVGSFRGVTRWVTRPLPRGRRTDVRATPSTSRRRYGGDAGCLPPVPPRSPAASGPAGRTGPCRCPASDAPAVLPESHRAPGLLAGALPVSGSVE